MHDAAVLLVAIAVAYLPGLALLTALGVRPSVLLLALAPAASITVAGVVAILAALLHVPYGPWPIAAVTVLVGAVPVVAAVRRRGDGGPLRSGTRPGRAALPSTLAGSVLVLGGVAFGAWSWLAGLGGLATVPQEHDMVIHAMQTAYITYSGNAAPWQLMPADVLTGSPVSYYPSGTHLLAAVVAALFGVVPALNAVTVVLLAGAVCVGVAALGAVAARALGLGRSSAAMVGGLAALVMGGMYRPGFHLMHDGGILGNAVALSLVPGAVAGVVALPRLPTRWAAAGVGVAVAGVVWAHPSGLVSVGLTVVAWWAGELVTARGRAAFRRSLLPGAVAGAVAVVLMLPTVVPGLGAAGRTGAFPPDTGPVPFVDALGSTLGFPFAGWLDQEQTRAQVVPAVLTLLGVLAVVALRRGLGPVTAWATWSVVVAGAWLSPAAGLEAPVTGFFYNAMLRTWSHISLVAPVLIGLGVVLTANRLAVVGRRLVPLRARPLAVGLAAAAYAAYALVPAPGYAGIDEESVATRYRTPDFVRVGPDDQQAIAWLADHIRPGQRVFNSPNDGSTYLYVERRIPVVNVYTLGLAGVPYSYRLLEDFNTYPTDPAVRQQLVDLDVAWVYVDETAPGIGSNGSPEGWAGDGGFTLAPGLADLDGLPGLRREFVSGSVTVYSLDLGHLPSPA